MTDFRRCASTGKRQFASADQAKRATRHVSNRLRAYLCPECHRWHVTNAEDRGKMRQA